MMTASAPVRPRIVDADPEPAPGTGDSCRADRHDWCSGRWTWQRSDKPGLDAVRGPYDHIAPCETCRCCGAVRRRQE